MVLLDRRKMKTLLWACPLKYNYLKRKPYCPNDPYSCCALLPAILFDKLWVPPVPNFTFTLHGDVWELLLSCFAFQALMGEKEFFWGERAPEESTCLPREWKADLQASMTHSRNGQS